MSEFKLIPLEERIVLDAAAFAVIYVNAAAHNGGNGESWAHAFNNLQEALTKAAASSSPEQIWIAKGTYTPSEIYSPNGVTGGASGLNVAQLETFNLPNNVQLYGGFAGYETSLSQRNPLLNPTILSGNIGGGIDVWHVVTAGNDVADTGVTATLDGLFIENGVAAGPDLLAGSSLLYSHESGGGLYARFGSNITLDDVTFQNDSASLAPTQGLTYTGSGGVSSGGGAIAAFDSGTLITISHSSFIDDNAGIASTYQAQGGAILISSGSAANISSSTFQGDTATINGGAIAGVDAGTLNISGSTFQNNAMIGPYAPFFGSGGAVNVFNASLNISDSSFTGNTSNWTAAAIGIEFQEDATPHEATIENSIINDNTGAFEGSVTVTSLGAANPSDLVTINNTQFIGNYGGGTAGAIDIDSIDTNISNSQFIGNVSGGVGGAINSDDFFNNAYGTPLTTVNVRNSTFIDNTAQGNLANIAAYNGSFSTPAFGAEFSPGGGAINSMWGSQLNVINSLFVGNTALNGDGGAIKDGGGNLYSYSFDFATSATLSITNDVFIGNSAKQGNGGAIANESTLPLGYPTGVPEMTLQNSDFTLNSASNDGGALYLNQTINTITGNTFLLDHANSGVEVYGSDSTVNGQPSSSPTAVDGLVLANNLLLSDEIVLV